MRVLILGAEGFIGRHLAAHFRAAGWDVLAHARTVGRLAAMGFRTVAADLAGAGAADPEFWRPHLAGGRHLVVASGLLTGPVARLHAVHVAAPAAALAALEPGARAVLVSAVGLEADTAFAACRRKAEAVFAGQTVLRAGLVMADTSYGGSSLLRALAALPVVPLIGGGGQPFNPIHAADLAAVVEACLREAPGPGPWDIGGPETLTQAELIGALRAWMGRPPARGWHLPLGVARAAGRLGDALDLGPVSATAVAQLQAGVAADPGPLLARIAARPRGVRAFLAARPAGTQDLWQARLYLMKPLIRLGLAAMWLASGVLGLMLPATAFLPALPGWPEGPALALARAGGVADLALAAALLANWRPTLTAWLQLWLVAGYTLGLGLLAPGLWLDPFGGLLKNLPVIVLLLAHLALVEER